jgi:hypothetical protein
MPAGPEQMHVVPVEAHLEQVGLICPAFRMRLVRRQLVDLEHQQGRQERYDDEAEPGREAPERPEDEVDGPADDEVDDMHEPQPM